MNFPPSRLTKFFPRMHKIHLNISGKRLKLHLCHPDSRNIHSAHAGTEHPKTNTTLALFHPNRISHPPTLLYSAMCGMWRRAKTYTRPPFCGPYPANGRNSPTASIGMSSPSNNAHENENIYFGASTRRNYPSALLLENSPKAVLLIAIRLAEMLAHMYTHNGSIVVDFSSDISDDDDYA